MALAVKLLPVVPLSLFLRVISHLMPFLITIVTPAIEPPQHFESGRQCCLVHTGIVVAVAAGSADTKLLAHAFDEIIGRCYLAFRFELVLRLLDRIDVLTANEMCVRAGVRKKYLTFLLTFSFLAVFL